MIRGYSYPEAYTRYLQNKKNAIEAANVLRYDKLCNQRFIDHTLAIMRTELRKAARIVEISNALKFSTRHDELEEMVQTVNKLINDDHRAIQSLTSKVKTFDEALKEYMRGLMSETDNKNMLDVCQAFHQALLQ